MKTTLLLTLLLPSLSFGAYEAWTSKDGRTAQLELIKVTGEGDELAGEFRMKGGKRVTLKAAELDEVSATKLKQNAAKDAPVAAANKSVFDDILDKNLVKLDGEKLSPCTDSTKPTKYYIYYYTASWCGPCQAFTPSLVAFYNETKPNNSNFELVLISWDEEKKGMEGYAVAKKMPWPQLELSKVESFQKKFEHGVTGIPSVVVCDLEGKVVLKTRDLAELKKLVK